MKTAGEEAGAQPPLAFPCPELSRSMDRAQPQDSAKALAASAGDGSGSTQVQTPAQRLKPVKPERGIGQDYQFCYLTWGLELTTDVHLCRMS